MEGEVRDVATCVESRGEVAVLDPLAPPQSQAAGYLSANTAYRLSAKRSRDWLQRGDASVQQQAVLDGVDTRQVEYRRCADGGDQESGSGDGNQARGCVKNREGDH